VPRWSVERGQTEAAKSIGTTPQILVTTAAAGDKPRHPALTNELISMTKGPRFSHSVHELTRAGQAITR
jgi:ABC-type amino acid transport system permease subunit